MVPTCRKQRAVEEPHVLHINLYWLIQNYSSVWCLLWGVHKGLNPEHSFVFNLKGPCFPSQHIIQVVIMKTFKLYNVWKQFHWNNHIVSISGGIYSNSIFYRYFNKNLHYFIKKHSACVLAQVCKKGNHTIWRTI